jgi:hypothetical protein
VTDANVFARAAESRIVPATRSASQSRTGRSVSAARVYVAAALSK